MKYLYTFALSIICLNASAALRNLPLISSRQAISDTDTIIKKQSVAIGITAGSDASFFGRTSPKRYPYYTADVIYNAKSGFFAYGSIWKVAGSFPTLDEVDAGAGYVYRLSKKLTGTASYTHFFFNRRAQIIKSLSTNDIDFKNTYDFGYVKSSLAFDYLFGKASDIFLTPSISKYIEPSWGVFDNKDYLTFTPTISMIFGTQNFVENYSNIERDDHNTGNGFGHESDDFRTAHANRQFNVLNYSLKLPVAYNRAHYTFEASAKYSIPVNVEGQLKNR